MTKRICVSCGCTDEAACPGGCSWVSLDPPLCSACLNYEPSEPFSFSYFPPRDDVARAPRLITRHGAQPPTGSW